MMKFLPVINERSGLALHKRPLVAVDLGFSGNRRTTGVAWTLPSQSDAKKYQFVEAVTAVVEKCRSLDLARKYREDGRRGNGMRMRNLGVGLCLSDHFC